MIKKIEFTKEEVELLIDDYENLTVMNRNFRIRNGLDGNKLSIVDEARLNILKKLKGGEKK